MTTTNARVPAVDPKIRFLLSRLDPCVWERANVFARSLAQREGAPEWSFYDGPPTGTPNRTSVHAVTRTFKDVYPRTAR